MHETKKMNKIEKICRFWPYPGKISVHLEDEYYQNGKNEIQKIYNFCFLDHILTKIIINFSDFSIFLIYAKLSLIWIANFPNLRLKSKKFLFIVKSLFFFFFFMKKTTKMNKIEKIC